MFKEIGKNDIINNTFKLIIRLKLDISKIENLFLLNFFEPDILKGTKHKSENIKKSINIWKISIIVIVYSSSWNFFQLFHNLLNYIYFLNLIKNLILYYYLYLNFLF